MSSTRRYARGFFERTNGGWTRSFVASTAILWDGPCVSGGQEPAIFALDGFGRWELRQSVSENLLSQVKYF